MLLVLLTRLLLWALIGLILWYLLVRFIPKAYLTWFGGFVLLALIVLIFARPQSEELGVAWQILSLPLKPLGLVLFLLLASFRGGWKKVDYQQVTAATVILLLCSLPIFAALLAGQLERSVFVAAQLQRSACQDICPVDLAPPSNPIGAIVTLNEGITHIDQWTDPLSQINQSPNGILVTPQVASLLYTAQVYLDQVELTGNRPLVIVTGGPPQSQRSADSIDESDRIQDFLVRNGVPSEQIQVISTGNNVRSTVLEAERILGDRAAEGFRQRIIAIAPAITMRRVGLAFYRRGIQTVARPSDYYVFAVPEPQGAINRLASLIPSAEALALTTRATNEYLLSIYYFLRDWLPGFNVTWQGPVEVDERQLQNLGR